MSPSPPISKSNLRHCVHLRNSTRTSGRRWPDAQSSIGTMSLRDRLLIGNMSPRRRPLIANDLRPMFERCKAVNLLAALHGFYRTFIYIGRTFRATPYIRHHALLSLTHALTNTRMHAHAHTHTHTERRSRCNTHSAAHKL